MAHAKGPVKAPAFSPQPGEAAPEADIVFSLREKPARGIYGTGGAAGGYIGIFYAAFNLLGLGEKLALELDGGASQSTAIAFLEQSLTRPVAHPSA